MFDSPLFWIALIWWLLSAVAGHKKRKRQAQSPKPEVVLDEPVVLFDDEYEPPAEQPPAAPQYFEQPITPEQVPSAEPPPSLADLLQRLGIVPKQSLEPVFVPEEVVPEPEPPQAPAEEVPVEEVPAVRADIPRYVRREKSPLDRFDRLPALQRAIILKELLDRPKALRRPGLF